MKITDIVYANGVYRQLPCSIPLPRCRVALRLSRDNGRRDIRAIRGARRGGGKHEIPKRISRAAHVAGTSRRETDLRNRRQEAEEDSASQ